MPLLWSWLKVMATEPWARGVLLDTAWRLVVVLAVGLAVEWAVRRARAAADPGAGAPGAAQRQGHAADEDAEARAESGETEPPRRRSVAALTLLRRVPLVLGRFVLELLPVLALPRGRPPDRGDRLGGEDPPRLVLLAVIDAYALCAAILCVARVMFSPAQPRLRLLDVPDDMAAYAMRWIRRIAVVSVFGYAVAEVGLLLGLSDAAHDALLKAVGLVDHVFLGIIVLQQRRTVRRLLRAPEGASGPVAALRNWLARIWHWLALLLLAALWLAWAVEVQHGYARMLRYCRQRHRGDRAGAAGADRHPRRARPRADAAAGCGVALSGHRGAARALPSGAGQHRARG